MKVLLLHGLESTPGGTKADFLAAKGCVMINPALPKESWEHSLEIAQAAYDTESPDVVVGSSRGGAVALNLKAPGSRLVLIAPAWKRFGSVSTAPAGTIILHSELDDVVPISESRELAARSGAELVTVGTDHRMKDPAALEALWKAVEGKRRTV